MKTSAGISLFLLLSTIAWQAGAQLADFSPKFDINRYMDDGIMEVIPSPVSDESFFGNPNPYIAEAFAGAEMVIDINYNDKWLRVGITDMLDNETDDELGLFANSYLFYDAAIEYRDDECLCFVDNIVAEIRINKSDYESFLIAMPLSMLSDEFIPYLRRSIEVKNADLNALMAGDDDAMSKQELRQRNREVRNALDGIERLMYTYTTTESTVAMANSIIEQRVARLMRTFSTAE